MPRSTAVRGGSEWRDHLAADVARAHIERILKESGWNLTHAAETLGIDRSTLYSKINSPGLKRHVVSCLLAEPGPARVQPFFDKRASPAPAGNCFCECPQTIMRKEPASELLGPLSHPTLIARSEFQARGIAGKYCSSKTMRW